MMIINPVFHLLGIPISQSRKEKAEINAGRQAQWNTLIETRYLYPVLRRTKLMPMASAKAVLNSF